MEITQNKIVEMRFGSHLYGTNTPDSDTDLKGIYIPDGRDIILHRYKPTLNYQRKKKEGERNTKDDFDMELLSLDNFVKLLMEGQTMALDMLFAPKSMWTGCSPIGEFMMDELMDNRLKLISKNVASFVGYARQQASKYGIKGSRMDVLQRTMSMLDGLPLYDRLENHFEEMLSHVNHCSSFISLEKTPLVSIVSIPDPNGKRVTFLEVCGRKIAFTATVKVARECYGKILAEYGGRARKANLDGGIDWKALSHAVRVNSEAIELLSTGTITFPRPDRELLLQIKFGQLPYEKVAEMIEQGLSDLYDAKDKSKLREVPDYAWADEFIYDVYASRIR